MKRLYYFIAAIVVIALFMAEARGANVAINAATKGHVQSNAPAADAARRSSPACFWQVPGQLNYVNLYTVENFYVTDHAPWRTILRLGYRNWIGIEIPPGKEVNMHINMIIKRLGECEAGV